MHDRFFIGVDVGTGSARAGVFGASGRCLASAVCDFPTYRPQAEFVQQSSTEIWSSVCDSVRTAVANGGIAAEYVRGIGFDATCSLVVLDAHDQPVAVGPDGDDRQNIIVWMDHRAVEQARRINRGNHDVLKYVGGAVSPEMQTPKLLWLKERLPTAWERAQHFFDLPDYLTFRATGDRTRSLCSTVCKWTYLGHEADSGQEADGKWDSGYFRAIGLGDLVDEGFRRIGTRVRPMGEAVGQGLTPGAAAELGLRAGTAVAISLIDAHAGGLGMIGATLDQQSPAMEDFDRRLALIGGTSSCHMAVSSSARFVPGVWGPYFSAMVPGMWLTEGGQSATGALIDFVIDHHGATAELRRLAETQGATVYEVLNERVARLADGLQPPASLTNGLHVCPYFHGNRSPWADPSLTGMISGTKLSASLDDLAILYLAVVQAIAYGTRHIIEVMNAKGYAIDTIFACGGGVKNPIFVREHADITGCRVALPKESDAVLLGSAMLAAVAGGEYTSLHSAMAAMSGTDVIVQPDAAAREFHRRKYAVFQRLHADQLAYRELMSGEGTL